MKKTALRTDESRFAKLTGYPFTPHYLFVNHPDYAPLRMHFIDESESAAPWTVLLLHGCPTWSYLYRHVVSGLLATGQKNNIRIVAPDFIGCGKSDKLLKRDDYSYDFHVDTLQQFIEKLDLENIVLVCQDWGGPIGLRVLSELPQRFAAVVASNTLLPNCAAPPQGVTHWPGPIIEQWVNYTKNTRDIVVSQVVQGVTLKQLSQDVLDAYDAPFPDVNYKQGMLVWPSLIPRNENSAGIRENRKAWAMLEKFNKPFVTAFSDSDPSTADWETVFRQRVPGAKNQAHPTIAGAGHMVQEDNSEALVSVINVLLTSLQLQTGS